MNRIRLIVAAAALGLAATMPAAAKVNVIQSPSAALAPGSSFAWAEVPARGFGLPDPQIANEVTADRLARLTEVTLTNKGYRQIADASQADLLIAYTIVILPEAGARLTNAGAGCPPLCAASDFNLEMQHFTQGTLVLDLIERASGRLVWRATSEKRVTGKDVSQEKLEAAPAQDDQVAAAALIADRCPPILIKQQGRDSPDNRAGIFTRDLPNCSAWSATQSSWRIELRISTSVILATLIAAPFATAVSAAEFDGPFVGAQLGWQSEQMDDLDSSFGVVPVDESQESVTGGLFAGYDKTVNDRFVIGAEAGLDFASDDEVESSIGGINYATDPKHSFDLTARGGYLVSPETLLYLRGGYTHARLRTTITDSAGTESSSSGHDGWLLGAGAERQVNDRVSARIEYRYSDFSEDDGELERNRLLAGLAYRF